MKYVMTLIILATIAFISVESYRAFDAAKIPQVALCENPACGNK